MRKWLIVCLIAFLLISPVAGAQHQIRVDEKRIEGHNGAQIYIVGEQKCEPVYGLLWEEYCVSVDDYDKINYGDKITLEHDTASYIFKLVSSEQYNWWLE